MVAATSTRLKARSRKVWIPFAVLAVFAVVTVLVAVLFYNDQKATLEQQALRQIQAVAELKTNEISRWRTLRVADGDVLQQNRALIDLAAKAISEPDNEQVFLAIEDWFEVLRSDPNYSAVYLVGRDGAITKTAGTTDAPDRIHIGEVSRDRMTSGAFLTDFHQDEDDKSIHLYVVVPLNASSDGAATGSIVLEIDPELYLYPYLQTWPVPSDTAETLLVQQEGGDVLFLNDLRFEDTAALTLRVPIKDNPDLPAARAALGEEGPVVGPDYRNVVVVAEVRAIPDSPWFLVSKMDQSEAYSDARARLMLLLMATTSLLVTAAGLAAFLWRNQRAHHYRELLEAELEGQEALKESENRFRLAVIGAPFPIMIHAEDGTVITVNTPWTTLTGYEHSDIPTIADWTRKAYGTQGDVVRADIDGLFAQDGPKAEAEYTITTKSGDSCIWDFSSAPMGRMADGRRLVISMAMDVTDRKAVERELELHRHHLEDLVDTRTQELANSNEELDSTNEELQCLVEELESSNDELQDTNAQLEEASMQLAQVNQALSEATLAKSRFLANMSHELRTPLNSIIGFSGTIGQGLAGPLTDEQRTQVEMISGSGRYLLALINDILDLAKVESGTVELALDHIDLADVVRDILELMEPQAHEAGLAIEVQGIDQPHPIHSDRRKIHQILLNLIGNAIKFTDEGTIAIRVDARADGSTSVSVSDTGPGIAKGDLSAIFGAFAQVNTSDLAKPKGTGLGLAISQEYARLLGGEILVHSRPGDGATFTLNLPARKG